MSDDVEAAKAEVLDRLADDWRLLKVHHPVGAYLPIGQLDGDCKCGSGAWPCATVRAALDSKAGDPNGN